MDLVENRTFARYEDSCLECGAVMHEGGNENTYAWSTWYDNM